MTAITELQSKVGVNPDGGFGPATLKAAMKFFNLSKEEGAMFFGQCSHETGGFHTFIENLNYSAQGLRQTFQTHFTQAESEQYARNPQRIANRVYANRMGNGNEASGDGWTFRGRGAIQLTGRSAYSSFSSSIGQPVIMTQPDIVATAYAFESGKWFFDKNNIWSLCSGINDSTITAVTRKVNGGTNGLADRLEVVKQFYSWL